MIGRWFAAAAAGFVLLVAAGSFAHSAGAPQGEGLGEKRSELQNLQREMQRIDREVRQTESRRRETEAKLKEAERAANASARKLERLRAEEETLSARIAENEATLAELERSIAQHQEEVAAWAREYYRRQRPFDPIFSSEDPAEAGRRAHYLELLAADRARRVAALREQQTRAVALRAELERRQERLARVREDATQEAQRWQVLAQQRRQLRESLAQQLQAAKDRKREIEADAAALTQLVRRLEAQERARREEAARQERLRREEEARRERERREAAQRAAAQAKREASVALPAESSASPKPPEDETPSRPARRIADASAAGAPLSGLRGRLGWPVQGSVQGRFGASRPEGGTWRGVFIAAGAGQPVRAVADGMVAYADWLRGYGNLIILDHGGGYLTVYANADTLLREPQQRVQAGEMIATTGTSGNMGRSGLYFEIRHNGEPLDPLRWIGG
ncbi:MAG: peptidoglycan DD-metalloendopeptidase family protein [Rhodocyclales bacterium]|nr:peptidoglycan DD-metalloendopeptidase family protein [Rhodocyclales bacterium]